MAKRTQGNRGSSNRGRKSNRGRSASAGTILERPLESIDLRKLSGNNVYKKSLRTIIDNPVALYLAGTVGAFFLGRFAYRYYQNHPEISEFIRDNFDTVEGKLRDFRGGSAGDVDEVARH